jgi:PKD repeat protein
VKPFAEVTRRSVRPAPEPAHVLFIALLLVLLFTACGGGGGGGGGGAPANQAPTAVFSATPTNGVAPLAVAFNAAASTDADGTINGYAWNFGDGATGAGQTATHAYSAGGTFTATLTVTDDDGATAVTSLTITVNQAPTAAFSATPAAASSAAILTTGNAPLTVAFDASASFDVDGTIETFEWIFGDGAGSTGRTTSHTYTDVGTYNVILNVTDDDGHTAGASQTITVTGGGAPANQDPSAAFGATPTTGNAPLAVAFDASVSSDADGTITGYAWKFGDGTTGTGRTANHTYATSGSFTATLTVTDDNGATIDTFLTITVNQAPTADFSATPTTGNAPLIVSFDASASSDAAGTIEAFEWLFGDDVSSTGQTTRHTYTNAGTYIVTLSVTESDGTKAGASQTITVTGGGSTVNQAPSAAFSATPTRGNAPMAVVFDAAVSADADGTVSDYAWVFGDGATGAGRTATHAYNAEGIFTATLTVTDDNGARDTALRTIIVNQAPTAAFAATPASGSPPLAVAFNAAASTDPDGTIRDYAWDFGDGTTDVGQTANHTYATSGTFTATLTVTDDGGVTDTAS